MLKIEPTEAESVAIALPGPSVNLDELARELDSLARKGDAPQVNQLADQQVLQARMGLSAKDCKILADAARTLTERRYAR
jgi:membrane carboxypeptidase/penicillin-binding protein PbpC